MPNILKTFLQVAGARPFSDFINGGKNNSPKNKRTNKKSIKGNIGGIKKSYRLNNDKRKSKRTRSKVLNERLTRRTINKSRKLKKKSIRNPKKYTRRSKKLSNKKIYIRTRNLSKRKFSGSPGKYLCNCGEGDKKGYFTGEEPSPKGLGYWAQCTPINVTMKVKDGNLWTIKKLSNGKRWIKFKDL